MTKILQVINKNYFLIIVLGLFIFFSPFMHLLANINVLLTKKDDIQSAEVNILKEENANLKKELADYKAIEPYAKYNYSLTRMSYREIYNNHKITILGGEDKSYIVGSAVINSSGLIGIITKVLKTTSEVTLLTGTPRLSVVINDTYGTLSSYQESYLVIKNISNYTNIHLNDEVYTSTLGSIKEKLFIGTVYKIEEGDIDKSIYVKTNVDFNNLNYLYVVGDI